MSKRRWDRDGVTTPLSSHLDAVMPRPEGTAIPIQERWAEAVGAALSRKTRVVDLRKGVLQITAENPVWKAEVERLIGAILPRLQQGGLEVLEIRVRLA